jgi:murein DD-endopeptidase MepM/ murein hydrolase activator NlpD
MPLVIGLAALLGAVLLLASGITDASFADVATGKAGQLYRQSTPTVTSTGSTGASTASGASTATGTAAGGLANPFPHGWTPGRLDLGYDGTFTGSLVSPVSGVVTYAANSFSNWGGWVQVKADAPIPGLPSDTFYFAEGLAPTVKTGQRVTAGQQIAVPSAAGGASQGVGPGTIEWGLSQPGSVGSPTDPLASTSSNPATLVIDFAHWVEKQLGLPAPSQTSHAGYA